jgi:hypothetical protein
VPQKDYAREFDGGLQQSVKYEGSKGIGRVVLGSQTLEDMVMKKLLSAALLTGALTVSAFAATSSTSSQNKQWDVTPYGYNFRVGVAFMSDDALNDDENWFSLGVDWNIEKSILNTGNSFLSIDFITQNFDGDGGTIWPVMLNNRFFTGDGNTYLIAGIGGMVVDLEGEAEFVLGGRLGAGVNFGEHLFLNGWYNFSRKVDGVNPSHLGVYLGYRF